MQRTQYLTIGLAVAGLLFSFLPTLPAVPLWLSFLNVPLWVIAVASAFMREKPASEPDDRPLEVNADTPPVDDKHINWKGLLFRSKSELKLGKALDHAGVMFASDVKFRLNAGRNRQRREVDFVVCHNGRWAVVEVDGPHHHAGADRERDEALRSHGVDHILRYPSGRCYNDAKGVVTEVLRELEAV